VDLRDERGRRAAARRVSRQRVPRDDPDDLRGARRDGARGRQGADQRSAREHLGTFFGIFYVGWLLAHAVTLRDFHRIVTAKWGPDAASALDPNSGTFLLIFALSAVVVCDAGAYFAGRKWGRRKLAPKISPGKTVEGALGGVVTGTVAALLCKGIFDVLWPDLSRALTWLIAVPLALVLAVAGMIGDLVESLLKRDAAQKDAGSLLPGMGGVLDRIDSALLAIPVMYYLMLLITYLSAGFR
jgi:phosphatidate cytidylyltransferase